MNQVKRIEKKKTIFPNWRTRVMRPERLPPRSTDESTIPGHTEHWGSGENPKPAGARDGKTRFRIRNQNGTVFLNN